MTKKSMCEAEVEVISRKIAKEEIDQSPLISTLISNLNGLQKTTKLILDRMWFIGMTLVCSIVGDIIVRLITVTKK